MSEALYHDALVRMAREALGAGRLDPPGAEAELDNPLCGDRVAMEVRLEGGRIAALAHRVRGCVLCQAAASFLGGCAPGRNPSEVGEARELLSALLGAGRPPQGAWEGLSVFLPVGAVKSRHRCVLLAFDALLAALGLAQGGRRT